MCLRLVSATVKFYSYLQTFVASGDQRNASSDALAFIVVTSKRFTPQHFVDQFVGLSERCTDLIPALLCMHTHKHCYAQAAVKWVK